MITLIFTQTNLNYQTNVVWTLTLTCCYCTTMFEESEIALLSKRKTCIKNLKKRVAKLKNSYIASLSEEDSLKPDNYLMILCMFASRKLNMSSKRHVFRSRKYHKNKGFLALATCPGWMMKSSCAHIMCLVRTWGNELTFASVILCLKH